MAFDLVNNTSAVVLAPAVRTADASQVVDLQGFGSSYFAALIGGEGVTLSPGTAIQVVVEHSNDNSTYVAVTDGDLIRGVNCGVPTAGGVVYLADDNAEAPANVDFGYRGPRRYVRVTFDFVGTHATGTPTALLALRGNPHLAPAA